MLGGPARLRGSGKNPDSRGTQDRGLRRRRGSGQGAAGGVQVRAGNRVEERVESEGGLQELHINERFRVLGKGHSSVLAHGIMGGSQVQRTGLSYCLGALGITPSPLPSMPNTQTPSVRLICMTVLTGTDSALSGAAEKETGTSLATGGSGTGDKGGAWKPRPDPGTALGLGDAWR